MSEYDRHADAGPDIHRVLASLEDSPAAPDFSGPIMRRLGYQRISPGQSRRRSLVVWANRAGMLMIVALAFAIGWRVFEVSPQVRRPAGATVPEAVDRDMRMQQQRIEGAIRGIRSISVPHFAPGADIGEPSLDADPDGQHHPKSQELQDDVNRSTMAAVRWV